MSRKHCLCCVIAVKKQEITNRMEVKTDDINNKIAQRDLKNKLLAWLKSYRVTDAH